MNNVSDEPYALSSSMTFLFLFFRSSCSFRDSLKCLTLRFDNTSFAERPRTVSLNLSSVFCVFPSLRAASTLRILLSLLVFDGESYILGGLSLGRCMLCGDLVLVSRASGKELSTF